VVGNRTNGVHGHGHGPPGGAVGGAVGGKPSAAQAAQAAAAAKKAAAAAAVVADAKAAEEAKPPRNPSQTLIDLVAKQLAVEGSEELLWELPECSCETPKCSHVPAFSSVCASDITFVALVEAFAEADPPRLNDATELLRALQKDGAELNADVFEVAIAACSEVVPPRPDTAKELLELMKATPDCSNNASLLQVYCAEPPETRDLKEIVKLLSTMVKEDTTPDKDTCCAVATALATAAPAHVDGAIQVLETMVGQGMVPTLAAFNAVIVGCSKASPPRVDDILGILGAMRRDMVSPDRSTYAGLLKSCVSMSPMRINEACVVIAAMAGSNFKPDAVSCSRVACSLLSVSGRPQRYADALRVMGAIPAGEAPSLEAYARCLKVGIDTEEGGAAVLVELLRGMHRHGLVPIDDLYRRVFDACVSTGSNTSGPCEALAKSAGAAKAFQGDGYAAGGAVIEICRNNAKMCTNLLSRLARKYLTALPVPRYDAAIGVMKTIDFKANTERYKTIGVELMAGILFQVPDVGDPHRPIPHPELNPRGYETGMELQKIIFDKAALIHSMMLGNAGIELDVGTWTNLLNKMVDCNPPKVKSALWLHAWLVVHKIPFDSATYNKFLILCTRANPPRINDALLVMNAMVTCPSGSMTPRRASYDAVLTVCAHATPARIAEVASVVAGMLSKKVALNHPIGSMVLQCLQKAAPQHARVATAVIAAMRGGGGSQGGDGVGDNTPPAALAASAAAAQQKHQQMQQMQLQQKQMQSAANTASGGGGGAVSKSGKGGKSGGMKGKPRKRDAATFSTLLAECLNSGDVSQAMGLLEEMAREELAPDSATYNTLIGCCLKLKPPRITEALQIVDAMHDSTQGAMTPRKSSYASLLKACVDAKPQPRIADVAHVIGGMLSKKAVLDKHIVAIVRVCIDHPGSSKLPPKTLLYMKQAIGMAGPAGLAAVQAAAAAGTLDMGQPMPGMGGFGMASGGGGGSESSASEDAAAAAAAAAAHPPAAVPEKRPRGGQRGGVRKREQMERKLKKQQAAAAAAAAANNASGGGDSGGSTTSGGGGASGSGSKAKFKKGASKLGKRGGGSSGKVQPPAAAAAAAAAAAGADASAVPASRSRGARGGRKHSKGDAKGKHGKQQRPESTEA